MQISVIVPFRNALSYLPACMDSLTAQSIDPSSFEVLFIDNNSTDGGPALVAANPRFTLLSESIPGSYAARNTGVRHAEGRILAFTDPDCAAAPNWLEKILAALDAPVTGIVLGNRSAPNRGTLLRLATDYETQKARYVAALAEPELQFGHTNNMAVRREIFDGAGPFPERIRGGDTIFVRRACDRFGTSILRFHEEVSVCHLEVADIGTYFKKCAIYGESNARLALELAFRPLSMRDRAAILRDTIQRSRRPLLAAALLPIVLIPGLLAYELGRLKVARPS